LVDETGSLRVNADVGVTVVEGGEVHDGIDGLLIENYSNLFFSSLVVACCDVIVVESNLFDAIFSNYFFRAVSVVIL